MNIIDLIVEILIPSLILSQYVCRDSILKWLLIYSYGYPIKAIEGLSVNVHKKCQIKLNCSKKKNTPILDISGTSLS